jgi:hypothetical protein
MFAQSIDHRIVIRSQEKGSGIEGDLSALFLNAAFLNSVIVQQ